MFRTTFDLTGFDPATARLEGECAGDDYVHHIRLNGKQLRRYAPKTSICLPLRIERGFVAGKNTLELVVYSKTRNGVSSGSACGWGSGWQRRSREMKDEG